MADNTITRHPASALLEITADGDLVLYIGKLRMKCRVFAEVLCKASPVFKAMLSKPNFKEGQAARSREAPQILELPEDDPFGVIAMCSLLHHRVKKIIDMKPGAHKLYNFAVAIDKYQCTELLQLQGQALLQNHFSQSEREESEDEDSDRSYGQLIQEHTFNTATAFLLNDSRLFKMATHRLMMEYGTSFSRMSDIKGGDLFGPNALLAMTERRNIAQNVVVAELLQCGIETCHEEWDGCYEFKRWLVPELEELFEIACWPPIFGTATWNLRKVVELLRCADPIYSCKKPCDHVEAPGTVTVEELRQFALRVESKCPGLCLNCVKEDRKELCYHQCTPEKHVDG